VQWLESPEGKQLFHAWRSDMHPSEDPSKTLSAFLELARTLAADIVPHMYALFPLPENACRPALSHPDFHSNNILVSYDNAAHITGVVDWEYASILPLWAVYTVPPEIEDSADEYELNPLWRAEKKQLMELYAQEVVWTCPYAAQSMDQENEQRIRGLRMLVEVATSSVALYRSLRMSG
jgi:aminoglycoside phosphotransferase (APT) family kinase protein